MVPITDNERRRAFSIWLRTGRLPSVAIADGVELKFNPWHDPADGQFTFAGSGRSYGQGGGGGFRSSGGSGGGASSREDWSREARSTNNRQRPRSGPTPTAQASGPSPRPAPNTNTQRPISNNGWGGGGFTLGGGGSFGGAGASGDWGADPSKQRTVSREPATARERQASAPPTTTARRFSAARPLHREVRNGYEYQIDEAGQTHRVSGTLKFGDKQVRSRTAQAQAGGPDRRATDDGGHYIAVRFAGPTDAFNHFAQDASFNRGRYRALEDQWARAKRAGKNVTVTIVPSYTDVSKRPTVIDISFTINGHKQSVKLANEPRGKRHGK